MMSRTSAQKAFHLACSSGGSIAKASGSRRLHKLDALKRTPRRSRSRDRSPLDLDVHLALAQFQIEPRKGLFSETCPLRLIELKGILSDIVGGLGGPERRIALPRSNAV